MNVVMGAVTLLAFGFVEVTTPSTTAWLDDYGTALQVARLAQRPLLVVIENPNVAEQRLDEIDEFGELLNNYELCRVDVTTSYGQKVAASYGATTFPYTAITDGTCRSIVYRGAGKFSPEIWERTLSVYSEGRSYRRVTVNRVSSDSMADKPTTHGPFAHADLAAAKAAAKQSGRPIMVFVTMPGCYHCERMKSETFQDGALQRRITKDFESVIVDQTDEPDWVYQKAVSLFPTTLVLDSDGEVMTKIPGYVSAQDLASRLELLTGRSLSQL